MKHKIYNSILRLIFIVWGIFLGLFAIEFYFRLSLSDLIEEHDSSWTVQYAFQLDKDLIYSYVPNYTAKWKTDEFDQIGKTNNIGCRADNFRETKLSTEYRVFFIGDSYTYGQGISTNELTYPALFEKYINRENDLTKKVNAYNCGVQGYSPDQEYRQLQSKITLNKPDMVIWTILIPADLYDLTHTNKELWNVPSLYNVQNNLLVPINAKHNWLYVQNWIFTNMPEWFWNSYTFKMIIRKISLIKFFNNIPYMNDRDMMDWGLKKLTLEIREAFSLSEKFNFSLIIVVMPHKYMYTGEAFSKEYITAVTELVKKLKDTGIRIIDMSTEINRYNQMNYQLNEGSKFQPLELYFKNDFHPNEKGADFFAKILSAKVLESKVIN